MSFRKECRDFLRIGSMSNLEFQRLGVLGDWQILIPPWPMTPRRQSLLNLAKLMDGSLYRGAKPVMWSPVEKTALAEAEIEYEDTPRQRSTRGFCQPAKPPSAC